MPIEFSLREHKRYPHHPNFIFTKSEASVLRMSNKAGGISSWGEGYFFIVVDRAWLNGKYLRWRWQADLTDSTNVVVRIYDGAYDRSSDVDFPDGTPKITKGNGLLQLLRYTSVTFGWETRDVQTSLAGGSEELCTIFVSARDHTSGGNCYLDLDWFEINSGAGGAGPFYDEQFTGAITMERSGGDQDYGYISTGTALPFASVELACGFEVGQGSGNLPAKFRARQDFAELGAELEVGQDSVNLLGELVVRHPASVELLGEFAVRRSALQELLAELIVRQPASPQNLTAKFRVERVYDLRGTAGIAFYWWGAANPPEAQNQLRLETPTGFWYTDFIDGPASFRYVFIPWGNFTWVSTAQRRLEPHRHGFNEPNKSQIDAILYTINTAGVRRIDYIHAPFMRPFPCKFTVRHPGSADLGAGFAVARPGSQNLPAGFTIRQSASQNLSSGFFVNQSSDELPSAFDLTTLEISLREHKSSSSYNPGWAFSKPSASIVRAETTAAGSAVGTALIFFTVSKEYIHGKYIRITWEGDYTWGNWGSRVYIYDGSYDRQSELDFPAGSGLPSKGNGLLQTGLSHSGDFGPVTEEFQVDVSGSALENVTIMVVSGDSWVSQWGWLEVDLIEINSAAAGVGTLWREPFNGDITMERLGSNGDYGYISAGQPPLGATQDLAAGFLVAQDSSDLAAGFNAAAPNENLPTHFIVRHPGSAELGASFDGQVSLNLAAGFTTQRILDLPGAFLIRQWYADLAAKITIRQGIESLPAKMSIIDMETEDFEDTALVDHYQHDSGPGFRNAVFPHTGTWSWRTPQGQVDVFDISDGDTLTYAKVTVWAFAGNDTRKIELLDSDFNTLVQTTWTVDGYIQKSVEFTGAVKYFRITCPAGANSGLWTDDIEIKWA